MCFYALVFKESQRKYLSFTINENMRDECAKDETFRNGFPKLWLLSGHWSWSLVTGQEELFHLELG